MAQNISLQTARKWIVDQVLKANIPGLGGRQVPLGNDKAHERFIKQLYTEADLAYYGLMSFEWEICWATSCNLSCRFETEERDAKDGKGTKYKVSVPSFRMSWSSTTREPANAIMAAKLYTDIAQLAMTMEAYMGQFHIESQEESRARERKIDIEKKVAEFTAGQIFELSKHNSAPDVPWDLYSHLEKREDESFFCKGIKGPDGAKECCNGKAKYLIWYKADQRFLARCGRHQSQVMPTAQDDLKQKAEAELAAG